MNGAHGVQVRSLLDFGDDDPWQLLVLVALTKVDVHVERNALLGCDPHERDPLKCDRHARDKAGGIDGAMLVDETTGFLIEPRLPERQPETFLQRSIRTPLALHFQECDAPIEVVPDPHFVSWAAASSMIVVQLPVGCVEVHGVVTRNPPLSCVHYVEIRAQFGEDTTEESHGHEVLPVDTML